MQSFIGMNKTKKIYNPYKDRAQLIKHLRHRIKIFIFHNPMNKHKTHEAHTDTHTHIEYLILIQFTVGGMGKYLAYIYNIHTYIYIINIISARLGYIMLMMNRNYYLIMKFHCQLLSVSIQQYTHYIHASLARIIFESNVFSIHTVVLM